VIQDIKELMTGFRKVFIFTEALVAFVILLTSMQLKDAAVILAVGTAIIGMLSAAVYGNVKTHEVNAEKGNPVP
jgi:hypothetical protein